MPASTNPKNHDFWYRVEAPHYVAGLHVVDFFVTEAAPILKWAVGKKWTYVQHYLIVKKKFKVELLDAQRPEHPADGSS